MNIQNNISLKNFNTFGIDVNAKYLAEIFSEKELLEILKDEKFKNEKKLVLGCGANILFTKDWDGIVLHIKISGIKVIEDQDDYVIVEVGAGVNWHKFVTWAVNKNYGGLENMALIPGSVGAAPVQNIAAYGENFQDVFETLDAINLKSGERKIFNIQECKFTYRDSYFKTGEGTGNWVVTKVRVKLAKNPNINTTYFETGRSYKDKASIMSELHDLGKKRPYSIKDIYDAVVSIRTKKLPDAKKIGNAGSVFKNPVITRTKYNKLLIDDPELQCYPVDALTYPKLDDTSLTREDYVKIPAGRLLDNLGWKGKRIGNAGVHEHHALIIVNSGNATSVEILNVLKGMQQDVETHYKIKLEPEIMII